MNEDYDKKRAFIIDFVYLCIGLGLYYIFFKYVLGAIAPFAIAAMITMITKPLVEWLFKVTKLPRKGVAAVVCFLFYAIIGVLLAILVSRLVSAAVSFISNLPQIYSDHIQPAITSVLNWYEQTIKLINPNMQGYLDQVSGSILARLSEIVAAISKWAVAFAQSMAVGVPKALVAVIFCITASFFLSMDYPRIRRFILSQFGEKGQKIISDSKTYIFTNFAKMLGQYIIIMCITGCELFIFMKIYQIRNTLALAVIIAVFDILPVIGVGTVAIPWTIVEFINGDISMGLKILFMYIFITVVRNVIEPKFVGKTVGLHPIIMLISMYCGAKIFGALGIVIMPFTFIVVQNLNEEGLIHLYRNIKFEEPKSIIKEKIEAVLHVGSEEEYDDDDDTSDSDTDI